MDVEGSRVWFTDLWNYSIIPYMLEAVREGLQVTHAHHFNAETSCQGLENDGPITLWPKDYMFHFSAAVFMMSLPVRSKQVETWLDILR